MTSFRSLFFALALLFLSPAPALAADRAVLAAAAGFIGKVPYRLGGEDPRTGLDCSGLTRLAYRRAHQRDLPHHAEDQYRLGQPVEKNRLQAGDLVFFGHGGVVTHVGIATGTGRFIHSASREGGVALTSLSDPYYAVLYLGARRLQCAGGSGNKPGFSRACEDRRPH